MTLQFLLRGFERGRIDGEARPALGKRDFMNVERTFSARNHRVATTEQTSGSILGCRLDLAAVEQLDLPGDDAIDVARFHRLDIPAIRPDELTRRRAQPNG